MATSTPVLSLRQPAARRELRQHQTLRRLARVRSGLVGLALLALAIVSAVGAPILAPYDYAQGSLGERLKPPAW